MGAFAIQIFLPGSAFTVILFFVAVVYLVTAPVVYRQAAQLVREVA